MKKVLALFAILASFAASAQSLGINADGSTANPSAMLDIKSTTKGFLPPRMSTAERDLINVPAAGLTIWNTTNTQLEVFDGAYWLNMTGKLVSTLNVGDNFGGGKVAYILTPNDPGYVAKQTHGFIAAPVDQTTDVGVKWFSGGFWGATAIALGQGANNTNLIITVAGNTPLANYAAGLASSYRGGGFTDWYLPSRNELFILYQNRVAIGNNFVTTGSILGYWTSSQNGALDGNTITSGIRDACVQFFTNGDKSDAPTGNLRRVRAIRSF